ncbi:GNAT family N-acetyltransferase [Limnobacter sp.]
MFENEQQVLVFQLTAPRSIDAFFSVLADDAIYQFIPAPPPLTLADFCNRHSLMNSRLSFGAYLDSERKVPIGLLEVNIQRAGLADVGFMLGRAYWRRGFGSQIIAKSISQLDSNIRTLRATVDSRNIGSIRALEKNQFVQHETRLGMLKRQAATEYVYLREI